MTTDNNNSEEFKDKSEDNVGLQTAENVSKWRPGRLFRKENPYPEGFFVPWLPGRNSKLIKTAREKPKAAMEFVELLIRRHPSRLKLAMHISHAAFAGFWLQKPLDPENLEYAPDIPLQCQELKPPDSWYTQLETCRKDLLAFRREHNPALRIQYLEQFQTALNIFEKTTLDPDHGEWSGYYSEPVETWRQAARDELNKIRKKISPGESVSPKIFKFDGPLKPVQETSVFVGRTDLADVIKEKLETSVGAPIFLVHGQPGCGKTSFIFFTPQLLNHSVELVYVDLKDLQSIHQWIKMLMTEFSRILFPDKEVAPLPEGRSWPDLWKTAQDFFVAHAATLDRKILLVSDRYEKLHGYFQQRPEAAESLLAALRSFSQNQDRIALVFSGVPPFSDFRDPYWSNYFVQPVRLKLDYLSWDETRKLMDMAHLDYHSDIREEIFNLTQGHPAMIQQICRELVQLANDRKRPETGTEELTTVIHEKILTRDNPVMQNFWLQLSADANTKLVTRQIVNQQRPTEPKSLFYLQQHGYIEKTSGGYRMRSLLLQEWLKTFS